MSRAQQVMAQMQGCVTINVGRVRPELVDRLTKAFISAGHQIHAKDAAIGVAAYPAGPGGSEEAEAMEYKAQSNGPSLVVLVLAVPTEAEADSL